MKFLFGFFFACITCISAYAVEGESLMYEQNALLASAPDPLESWNRKVFVFNDWIDGVVVRPVAQGYVSVIPDWLRAGVSNFFDNLGELDNLFNNLFQAKWAESGITGARFLINSTLGLLGALDLATGLGFAFQEEDFGQTIGRWGVAAGPYLVLPGLGPSSMRDTLSMLPSVFLNPLSYVHDAPVQTAAKGLELLDLRASLLGVDEIRAADPYSFLREAYLQRREFLVNDGVVQDDFLDDDW